MNEPALGAVLYVLDLENMRTFYREGLGLRETHVEQGYAMLAVGPTLITLVQAPPHLVQQFSAVSERREENPIKLSFPTSNIADARSRIAMYGGIIDEPECEWKFGNVRVCDGNDPEGNVIQLRTIKN